MDNNFIKKDVTNYLKGIAIISLLIHHFFTFPEWQINNIYPSYYTILRVPTLACLHIFSFLTGYFFYYHKDKTLKYSLKKILQIWGEYLKIFIPILIIALLLNKYEFTIGNLLLDTFALQATTMSYCLYIPFYCFSIILISIYSKIEKHIPIYISIALLFIIKILIIQASPILCKMYVFGWIHYIAYFPIIGIGYLVAKCDIMTKIDKKIKNDVKYLLFNIMIILIAIIMMNDSYLYYFSSFLIILGLVRMYNLVRNKKFFIPITFLGKKAISIWLIHCIFFNQFNKYTQPILYFPRNPILVLIWGILQCIIIAYIIDKLSIASKNFFKSKIKYKN